MMRGVVVVTVVAFVALVGSAAAVKVQSRKSGAQARLSMYTKYESGDVNGALLELARVSQSKAT